ncbi:MAG: SurA N-terminal domain-containing protein [Patescibacteria group bacterium]
MQKKIIIASISAIIVLAVGAGAWFYFSRQKSPETTNTANELFNLSSTNPATSSLAGNLTIPDIVARVNGQEITKADLEKAETQIMAQQGINPQTLNDDMRKQLTMQALESLVGNTLIRQAAANSGITVEPSEIDARLDMVKANFASTTDYQAALVNEGLTEEAFRQVLSADIVVQKYLDGTLNLQGVDATEEEISAIYAQQASSTPQAVPPLDEIHDQVKGYIVQQKQQQLINDYVQQLKSSASIETMI